MIYTCPNCRAEFAQVQDVHVCPRCATKDGVRCKLVPLRTHDIADDIKVIHESSARHLCELMLALDENVEDLPPPVQQAFCQLASDLNYGDEVVALVGSLLHTVLRRICEGYTPPTSDEG